MNQPQKGNEKPPGQIVNWPLIACYSVGLPLELLLHHVTTFGVRSVGSRGGAAVLIMFLFVAFHPGENCLPLICFLVAVIALSAVARISAMVRQWRGEQCHSRYNGRPRLMRLLPNWNEVTIKRLEPWLMLMVGFAIHHFNCPLGSFWIAAAVGLGVRVGVEYRGNRTRALNMNDSFIEQKVALEDLRQLQRR